MTRLQTSDIENIAKSSQAYNRHLKACTGFNLTGIAAMACGYMEHCHGEVLEAIRSFPICVVPVTAGLGIISTFSETVCAILNHMGFPASITAATDTSGIAQAFESNAHAVMMSDDHRFVGLNLHNRRVADNSHATGKAFATALNLMARGVGGKDVLVMGCGPVGASAAAVLLNAGARVTLYDTRREVAQELKQTLNNRFTQQKDYTVTPKGPKEPSPPPPVPKTEPPASYPDSHKQTTFNSPINVDLPVTADLSITVATDLPVAVTEDLPITVAEDLKGALTCHRHIIEATPAADTITKDFVFPETLMAAPGVPLGLTREARLAIPETQLIHDKLELGVAVMAVSLLTI